MSEVRLETEPTRPEALAAVSRCLALAFEDDPVSEFLFPALDSRAGKLRPFYRAVLKVLVRNGGVVYRDDEVRGVAIWQGRPPMSVRR